MRFSESFQAGSVRSDDNSAVVSILETLIAPGGRARLSPLVQAAQFEVLFGYPVHPTRRGQMISDLLPEGRERLAEIARQWDGFVQSGKPFGLQAYTDEGFLDAYLAYYFTFNVPKIQQVLLDLVRNGHVGQTLDVLDIGVGTGVTSIALLDFLLAWGYACELTGTPFPVKDLRFAGLDQTSTTLRKAQCLASAYAGALGRRLASRSGTLHGRAEARPLERVHRWAVAMAEDACWLPCVLDRHRPTLPWSPNILVASYVLSELDQRGREQLEALIDDLPD